MSNFYSIVVNDWDETTYVPTLLGNVMLAVIIAVLFILGLVATKKLRENSEKKMLLSASQLAFCGVAIALGTILSNIKVFRFPTGGAITLLSMLVICLPGYFYGVSVGILTGIAYGILQMIFDPYILFPTQLVVDYILAFGALGLSGIFKNSKNGLVKGYIAAIIGRFIFSVISGWIFFGSYAWDGWNPFAYSLAYNAIYIFAEGIITVIIINIPAVKNAIATIKSQVLK